MNLSKRHFWMYSTLLVVVTATAATGAHFLFGKHLKDEADPASLHPEGLAAERSHFARLYPKVQIDAFQVAPIKALREVQASNTRFYFDPESGLLLFGELFDKTGAVVNASAQSAPREEHKVINASLRAPSSQASGLDLHDDAALTITEGKVPVTAYLDFRCGHCARAVSQILDAEALPGASLRVVFVLRTREDFALATHVACASKHLRARALIQAFGGVPPSDRLSCEKGRSVAAEHVRVVARNGVSATPVFAVGNQTILGFNEERLGSLMHQTGEIPGEMK